jgi:hydrogenase/urease accessory protein HupE
MRGSAVAIILAAGEAFAHPGHGAPEGHFHGLGWDYLLWAIAIVAIAAWAAYRAK